MRRITSSARYSRHGPLERVSKVRSMNVLNKERAVKGANVLLSWVLAQLFFYLVQIVAFRVVAGHGERLSALFELVWLGMAVWMAVGLVMIATAVDRPGLIWTTVALDAVSSVFSLGLTLGLRATEGGSRMWLSPVSTLLTLFSLTERIVFLVLMVKLCGPKRTWALMVALVSGGIAVLRMVFSMALSFAVVSYSSIIDWYPYVTGLMGLVGMGCSVALVVGVRSAMLEGSESPSPGAPSTSVPVPEAAPVSATADFGIGGALLLGGIVVSVVSYSLASSGGGGRYVVATGLIGVGVGRIIRGFIRLGKQ